MYVCVCVCVCVAGKVCFMILVCNSLTLHCESLSLSLCVCMSRSLSKDEGVDQNPVVDKFLGHMGAVLSSFLHHVVAPPTPLYPTKFYPRVNFQVHLVTDHHVCSCVVV
jgi:hypothetical protein